MFLRCLVSHRAAKTSWDKKKNILKATASTDKRDDPTAIAASILQRSRQKKYAVRETVG